MSPHQLQIFIGSGEASLIERKVLQHSIHQHSGDSVQVHIYNGTHDTVEWADGRIERLHTPLNIKYANVTEFSNFRWFIPSLCGHAGRAIYLDSDMVSLSDLSIFQALELHGAAMMAKPEAYTATSAGPAWGMSMTVFDCAQCRWDPAAWFAGMERSDFTYTDLHQMQPAFLAQHPLALTPLPAGWNVFDEHQPGDTQLIHYTRLDMQPWKFIGHPAGDLWFKHLHQAIDAGVVTQAMIERQMARGYVRKDLLQGNFTNRWTRIRLLARQLAKEILGRR
jgi:hypothetical protein